MARDNRRDACEKELTPRQEELARSKVMQENLLTHLNEGLSRKEIAAKYGLSISAVFRAIKKIENQMDDNQCTEVPLEVTSQMNIPVEKSENANSRESERVRQLKIHFMYWHNKKLKISDIAKKFNVRPWTVYHHLQEIADANGVTRDSLLKIASSKKNEKSTKGVVSTSTERQNVNEIVSELQNGFEQAHCTIDNLIELVDYLIKKGQN